MQIWFTPRTSVKFLTTECLEQSIYMYRKKIKAWTSSKPSTGILGKCRCRLLQVQPSDIKLGTLIMLHALSEWAVSRFGVKISYWGTSIKHLSAPAYQQRYEHNHSILCYCNGELSRPSWRGLPVIECRWSQVATIFKELNQETFQFQVFIAS